MMTALEKAARAAWAKKFGVPFTALNEAQWADVFRDEWMSVIQAAFEAIQPIGAPFTGTAGIAAIIHDIVDSDLDGNLVHVDKAADAILAMLAASPQGVMIYVTKQSDPSGVSTGQAGTTEIEVTQAMIETGRFALSPTEIVAFQSEEEVLARVYRAMRKLDLQIPQVQTPIPPQPDTLPGDLREKVAAIIDANKYEAWTVDRANQMADAILSLIQSERG